MAELPGLAAGSYVLFLFYKSQAASANRKHVFSDRPPGRIFATPGCVDVGEKICRKADGLGEPNGQAQRSGDDVRRDLIFDESDAVAQLQFAFLQPLQPQQVRRRRLMQRVDRRIEITMFLLQPGELVFKLALIIVGHGVC
jgi:hypothetical protein